MFILSHTYAANPWHKKVLTFLYNWVMWFFEASYDALAEDVGNEYQVAVTWLAVLGWLALFAPWTLLYVGIVTSAWTAALLATVGYLVVGALYHAFEHYGPYA